MCRNSTLLANIDTSLRSFVAWSWKISLHWCKLLSKNWVVVEQLGIAPIEVDIYHADFKSVPIFSSLRNIKRSFYESRKWYFAGANWWFGIKTDQIWQRKQRKRSVLMPNHQLSPAKYHFHDSCHEHLMFRSETKIVEKIHCVLWIFLCNRFCVRFKLQKLTTTWWCFVYACHFYLPICKANGGSWSGRALML